MRETPIVVGYEEERKKGGFFDLSAESVPHSLRGFTVLTLKGDAQRSEWSY